MRSNRIPSLTAVTLGACLTACSACTGAQSERDDAGGPFDAEADRPVDALVKDVLEASDAEAAVQDARPDSCAPYPPSASVPPGWEPWTGWSCDCPLYHPGPGAEGPDPIEWEPCTAPIPSHLSCKRMKHAWNEEGPAIGLFPKWAKTASGSILSFSRVNFHGDRNARYILVADVDGPVHVGLLQINPENKGCVVNPEALSETRYLFTGLGDTWDGTLQAPDVIDGFLAGAIGEALPSTLMKEPKVGDLLSNWSISEDWIIQRRGDRVAWTWDLQTQHTVHTGAKDPDGLRGFLTTVIGKDVFVQVGDGLPRGVVTWNLEQGSRALIRWVGDATRGAGMFGTDGKDMVWTYVEGPLGDYKYDKMDVMTAPYTTEASQVQARRLRSDVKAFDPHSWVVGCGYAARPAGLDDPYQNALFIVRLSDGVSWILSGTNEPPKNQWGLPLGITCDEVFTTVSQKPSVRILRIRLDSLGPGTPPD